MENQIDQERAVRKAIEHIAQVGAHIQNCESLDPVLKHEINQKLLEIEQKIIVGWAKSLAA